MALKVIFELCYEKSNFHSLFVRDTSETDNEMAIKKASTHVKKFNGLKSFKVIRVTDQPVIFQQYVIKLTYIKPGDSYRHITHIHLNAENDQQACNLVDNIVRSWKNGDQYRYKIAEMRVI
jgi:hypothetical protein